MNMEVFLKHIFFLGLKRFAVFKILEIIMLENLFLKELKVFHHEIKSNHNFLNFILKYENLNNIFSGFSIYKK